MGIHGPTNNNSNTSSMTTRNSQRHSCCASPRLATSSPRRRGNVGGGGGSNNDNDSPLSGKIKPRPRSEIFSSSAAMHSKAVDTGDASLVYKNVRDLLLATPDQVTNQKGPFDGYGVDLKKQPGTTKEKRKKKSRKKVVQPPPPPPPPPPKAEPYVAPVVMDDRQRTEYKEHIQQLQKQLEAIEAEKLKEIDTIKRRKTKEKKELKAKARASAKLERETEVKSDKLKSNEALMMQIRNENDKIRQRNRDMQKNLHNLRVNNQRLSEITATATGSYQKSLELHHSRLESDNRKLVKAAADAKSKVDEARTEVEEVTRKIRADRFSVECYKRASSVAFSLIRGSTVGNREEVLSEIRDLLSGADIDESFVDECVEACLSPQKKSPSKRKKKKVASRKNTPNRARISWRDSDSDSNSSDNSDDSSDSDSD